MTKTMGVRRTAGAVMIGLSAFALAACGGGKPSEGDLKDHLSEIYTESGTLPDDQAGQLADCMAPKLLDQMSEDGLEAIMDADSGDVMSGGGEGISKEDTEALSSVGADCASEVTA